jgi:hypothetical protein
MSGFKPEQRHLIVRGRAFHFVLYEGQPARPSRNQVASPSMWYLMVEGRRCPVLTCEAGMTAAAVDAALAAWAEDNAIGPVEEPAAAVAAGGALARRRRANWWGPV